MARRVRYSRTMKLPSEFVLTPPQLIIEKVESDEDILAKKEQFAELSLREPNSFTVALAIYPDDTGKALRIANEWPNDPQVKTLKQSFVDAEEDGETAFLPTKGELARLIWTLANDTTLDAWQRDSRIKALRTYGDVRGFIDRPAIVTTNNNTQNVQVNKVMVVKSHDNWERAAIEQQASLRKEVAVSVSNNK